MNGVSYGGRFNKLRATVDYFAYRVFGGWPPWYQTYLEQDPVDWPVVIEFAQAGKVTKVKRMNSEATVAGNEETTH